MAEATPTLKSVTGKSFSTLMMLYVSIVLDWSNPFIIAYYTYLYVH